MSASILATRFAHVKNFSTTDHLMNEIDLHAIGRVDVLHIQCYDHREPFAVAVTLQVEVGLSSQIPGHNNTERAVAERLRRVVRRVTGDHKAEAQALALDHGDWYSTEKRSA